MPAASAAGETPAPTLNRRRTGLDVPAPLCFHSIMTTTSLEGLVRLTHIIYGLHAFSAVMGLISSAAVVTAFLTGWPSILAVILNYAKRADVRGTYLDSHFRWQIRTFWYAAVWMLVAIVLFATILGIPLAWLIVVVVGVWVLYRIGRGWMALNEGHEIGV
jgi:uncharacterized membrane protein